MTLTPRVRTTAELEVTARSGDQKVDERAYLRPRQSKKPAGDGGGGGGGGGSTNTCVQYFPDPSGETGGFLGIVPC